MLGDSPVWTAVPVKDPKAAREFYEGVLGLKAANEMPDGSIEYKAGNNTGLFTYPTPNAGKSPATLASWKVDDLEKTVGELKAKRVKFEDYDMPGLKTVEGIATMHGASAAWFKDPDGNILNLFQSN
jgi:catechol 2,3-dioxygenase-like lactoylglutathione lyase family enzyme